MDTQGLAAAFEAERPRLKALATRMLGSPSDAEDAVQEAWIRFSGTDTRSVENLAGWLTTVVSRLCLNVLQSRRRQVMPLGDDFEDASADEPAPDQEAVLADSIGLALLVVLENLAPAERISFVLHDMFAVPFEEIGPIVGRTPAAARQLASRARRRVRQLGPDRPSPGVRHARAVEAFLRAARQGDFEGLLAVLDPDVVVTGDDRVVAHGGPRRCAGAEEAATFLRRARGAKAVLVDGAPAAAWIPRGELRVVFLFSVTGDRITGVDLVADPDRLAGLDLVVT